MLRHQQTRGRPLVEEEAEQVMKHLVRLWGFKVRMEEVDTEGQTMSFRELAP